MTPPDSFISPQCSEQSEQDMIHGITNTLLKNWKYRNAVTINTTTTMSMNKANNTK